jgi:N-acetyl-gamma-glutamyl-phosphate reductase
MTKIHRIAIVGATGYTGLALIGLLLQHKSIEITHISSEKYRGQKFSEVYPAFKNLFDLRCGEIDMEKFKTLDLVFFATPNGIAHQYASELIKAGVHVIDLSADYRFRNLKTYEQWYGYKRDDSEDIKANSEAVYGLVEFKRDAIKALITGKKSSGILIGNPGCYTSASILALAPLLKRAPELCDLNSIIIDAKSGISGAGRKADLELIFTELNESVAPYKLAGQHRHTPELEAFFSELVDSTASSDIHVSFSPHLMPMNRGLLATCYINSRAETSMESLRQIYESAYAEEPFVQVLDLGLYPNTKWTLGTNRALIQIDYDSRARRIIATAAIDNLIKGAAGQAVQNMNLLLGYKETEALEIVPLLP